MFPGQHIVNKHTFEYSITVVHVFTECNYKNLHVISISFKKKIIQYYKLLKCNNCQGKSDIKYKNYKKEIPTEETDYDWPMVVKPCTPQ